MNNWKEITYRNLLVAAGIIVVLLMSVAGCFTYQQNQYMVEQRRSVMYTHELLTNISHLENGIRAAESGQRGYLLTGRQIYLHSYERGRAKVLAYIAKLDALINSPAPQARLDSIVVQVNKKMEELADTIRLAKSGDKAAASKVVLTDVGENTMESLTFDLQSLQSDEESLLEKRTNILAKSTNDNFVHLGLFSIFAVVCFALAAVVVHSTTAARRRDLDILNLTKSRFEELAESVDDIFFIVAADMSKQFYISPAYERIWGRPVIENAFDPMAFMEGIFEADRPKIHEFVKTFPKLQTGDYSETEHRVVHTDGTLRWVNVRVFPSNESETHDVRVCGTIRDITNQKDAERRVNEFYSTISHELRTPLTSIRGALGLLEGGKAGELSARGKLLVEIGRKECDRLVRLINDILDIRKIEAGKLSLKTERFQPSQIIDQVLENLQSYAVEHDVSLAASLQCDDSVNADRDRLAQILTNLVSNAIKFSPSGSQVLISTQRKESSVRFLIKDQGAGISKNDQLKLFKLFQQIDSSDSRPQEGTGLGLAICKALVEQHNGCIGLDSDIGAGSTFWFDLPLINSNEVAQSSLELSSGTSSDAKRILIVEDDDATAHIISEILVGNGFSVERVSALISALAKIQDSQFSAVILDLGLPDGSGFELIEEAQRSGIELPVVIVTASERLEVPSYPLVVDWISKPFGNDRLLRAVQLAVGGRRVKKARVLIVEDDPATLDVIRQQLQALDIKILEARDGRSAIEFAQNQDIDLIVLDLGLPDVDGFTVVTVLKNEARLRETPLIVYTARDLTDDDRNRLRLGLTTYLTKAKTSESDFVLSVRNLLNGLLSPEEKAET